jgi:hypothetical protein
VSQRIGKIKEINNFLSENVNRTRMRNLPRSLGKNLL